MTTLLEPDRDQIEIFYDAVLRHAGTDGYLAVRSFYHNEKPYFHHSVPLSAGFHHLIDDLEDSARRAANEVERIVFCPPVAVFGNGGKARQEDLLVGPTLSVELDNNPDEARATLIGLLGPPTVEVKSGGQWIDPDGKAYDKMHLHWRLRIPARTAEQLKQLKQCRILAAKLVNGDPTHAPISHPIRWPGSWHRKANPPRMCVMSTYDPDREIDLAEALAALTAAAPEPSKGKGNGKSAGEDTHAAGTDWESLIRGILTAKDYHNALVKMAAKLLASGMKGGAATNFMRALMAGSAGPRDDRWQARHDDIPRAVKTAEAKGWQQQAPAQHAEGVALEDFRAYMPQHSFIYMPSRELWPGSSVNARIGPVPLVDKNGQPVLNKKGEQETVSASAWLDRNRPVEQMTWAPGLPMLIRDRLIAHGGWINRKGVSCFNLYLPPTIELGNATEAGPWLDHVHKVFPNDAEHIILWLAHRVQHPGEKVNHALMLGGEQGIGKDSLLEPVKHAVGPWNFIEVTPLQMLGRFNGYIKAVVLRVNEARDLGEIDRFALYEHMKAPTAAPPDVLRVDEKNLKEHYVPNLCGVIITTNHKTDGIYLPPDDRRHYVAWSDLKKSDFDNAYWNNLWHWFSDGGIAHVAAYLAELDLSSFDAKAPPPKTPAFWAIVSASQPPEDAEMADVLDHMGNPDATTIPAIAAATAAGGFYEWLTDRKNRRAIPYRLEKCGYEQVRNNATKDGLWVVKGSRQVIYAKMALSSQDKYAAAVELAKQ